MFKQKLGTQTLSERKTIAIVANSSWNIYNFRLNLIRTLKQEGFRIIVIAPVDEYIHYLNETKLVKHIPIKHLKPHHKSPLRDLRLSLELYRIYKSYQPDLILHYTIKPNIFGSLAARWAKVPSIATITGLGYTFLKLNWINHLVSELYRLAFRKVEKVIFHNEDDQRLFIQNLILKPSKSTVIPGSGVNTNHYRPLVKPDTGKFIFLFIGRLLSDKGILEFVEASRQLKSLTQRAECWVVGEIAPQNPNAISKESVLQWMDQQHIRYFGKVSDVRAFIRKVDAVVLPSYQEGMPRALLEAMAMGKPIITTDTAGCRQTLRDNKNGLIVPVKNAKALLQAMLKMYQFSESELAEMGAESRKMVCDKFSDQQINSAYLTAIQQALGLAIVSKQHNKRTLSGHVNE